MTTIGLFEAKTKLSELCQQVAKRRESVVITRRGRPLVRIEPVGPGKAMNSVWDARNKWVAKHGPVREEFPAPKRARQTWRNPFQDGLTRTTVGATLAVLGGRAIIECGRS